MEGSMFSTGGNRRIGQDTVDVLHYLPEERPHSPSSLQLHVTSPHISIP